MAGYFKNKSLKVKLLYSCILITLVPMTIILTVFLLQIKRIIYDRELNNARALAQRLESSYSFELEKIRTFTDNLSEFAPLETYLNGPFTSTKEKLDYYKAHIQPLLAGYNRASGDVRIRIYHDKPGGNFSYEASESLRDFTEANFETDPFSRNISFWKHVDCYSFHPVLSYFKPVTDKTTYSGIDYVLAAHVKEKVFYSYIRGELAGDSVILVTDPDGYILSSSEPQYQGTFFPDPDALQGGDRTVSLADVNYRLTSAGNDILTVSVLVSDDALQRQFAASALSVLAAGIILLVISTLLVFVIARQLTGGVESLISKMNNVSRSSIHYLAAEKALPESRDEITQLDGAFTAMMKQIEDLVIRVKEEEAALKDEVITRQQAELSYLQQQINPHYLFNTLESIRMNLIIKNDYENANIVKLFAESFRRYINIQDKYSTLYEEMTFIEKYIAIQNYRLGDKIIYKLEADDALLNFRILRLLVQPVVENSVIHGVETAGGQVHVTVRIVMRDQTLLITVHDDGLGMDEDSLQALNARVHSEEGDNDKSIGLQNVYRRIRLAYGEDADLIIESRKNEGTDVTLVIPVRDAAN